MGDACTTPSTPSPPTSSLSLDDLSSFLFAYKALVAVPSARCRAIDLTPSSFPATLRRNVVPYLGCSLLGRRLSSASLQREGDNPPPEVLISCLEQCLAVLIVPIVPIVSIVSIVSIVPLAFLVGFRFHGSLSSGQLQKSAIILELKKVGKRD